MKDIKPYLPFYIGQKAIAPAASGTLVGVCDWAAYIETDENVLRSVSIENVVLELRQLSDMSEEELKELIHFEKLNREYADVSYRRDIGYNGNLIAIEIDYTIVEEDLVSPQGWRLNFSAMNAEDFKFLLSKGFDLFGLIDAGLAIDAKTLTN
jgi:hypothetical protein